MNVRDQVRLRAGGACERCGRSIVNFPASIHHRRPRQMGGTRENLDTLANLVVLCGSGTTGCHGYIESHRTQAIAEGWLVPRRDPRQPEDVPVVIYGRPYYVGEGMVAA